MNRTGAAAALFLKGVLICQAAAAPVLYAHHPLMSPHHPVRVYPRTRSGMEKIWPA